MCWGGSQPKAPQVVYQGPSEDDIRRNQESLNQFQQQITDQQTQFQTALQAQIDAADKEYADLESQYATQLSNANSAAQSQVASANANAQAAQQQAQSQAAGDLNAAAAAGAAQQAGAYKVSVTQSDPVNAQTTKAITDKKKPKSTLKIAQNAVEAAAGTGLNIGV